MPGAASCGPRDPVGHERAVVSSDFEVVADDCGSGGHEGYRHAPSGGGDSVPASAAVVAAGT